MRAPAQYTALHHIQVPGSYAFAARAGDDVTEQVRQNFGLIVGLDVVPLGRDSMERPADDAPRSEWQNYAVVRGVPYAEAVDLDTSDLISRATEQDDEEAPAGAPSVPESDDLKAAWVDYAAMEIVRETGGRVPLDEARERASNSTKATLIAAFGPEPDLDRRSEFTAVDLGEPAPDGTVEG